VLVSGAPGRIRTFAPALMQMGNRRPMAGWIRVASEVLDDDAVLERWVSRGIAYARSLPPKGERPVSGGR
jgi:hypothetical protein